jgi:ABC-2 type transport system ATP-binding protein
MTGPHHVPALHLHGVRQSYPIRLGLARKEVLHGIDLDLPQGASLGLVGPNGSGKSTLLRLIAGIEEPRHGKVEVFGHSPAGVTTRRRMGWLAEESPYPRELRAIDALRLSATLYGVPLGEVGARAEALLERVGLAHARTLALAKFSRGMARRFGLAAALIHEPDLVLLDEPTAGLDAPGFAVLEDLLGEAKGRGASLIVASHLLTDIQAHCDRLVVLVDGRVALSGSPRELAPEGGALELEVEGLSSTALDALEGEVRARGGRVLARFASARNLIELYRRFRPPSSGAQR